MFLPPSINMWTKVWGCRRCRMPGVPPLLCQLSPLSGTLHNDSFWEIIDCTAAPLNSSVMGWSGSLQEPGGPLLQTPDCLRQEGEGAGLEGLSLWQRSWLVSGCSLSGKRFSLACWKCHGKELHNYTILDMFHLMEDVNRCVKYGKLEEKTAFLNQLISMWMQRCILRWLWWRYEWVCPLECVCGFIYTSCQQAHKCYVWNYCWFDLQSINS